MKKQNWALDVADLVIVFAATIIVVGTLIFLNSMLEHKKQANQQIEKIFQELYIEK